MAGERVSMVRVAALVLLSALISVAPAAAQADRAGAESVLPSIVSVFTHFDATHRDGPGHTWVMARVLSGSGFYVGTDIIVTSAELVRHAIGAHVRAVVGHPNIYHVESVLAIDEQRGLALLKVASPARRPLAISRGEVKQGDEVHAVGSSEALGVVKGTSAGRGGVLLGISAPLWPGSGGGPVVSKTGEVVGVILGPPGAEDRSGSVVSVAGVEGLFADQTARRRLLLVPKALTISAAPRADPNWVGPPPKAARPAIEPRAGAAEEASQDAVLVRAATVWTEPDKVAACQLPVGARIALGSRSDLVPWMWNAEVREGPQRGCKGLVGAADFQLATRAAPAPDGPRSGSRPVAQALPPDGEVRMFTTAQRRAPLGLDAAPGQHSVVKLVEASTRATVMTIFVRGGTQVRIDVPVGGYEIRFATGSTWYGYDHLFGRETTFHKVDKLFDFRDGESALHGFRVTLYPVPGGQLRISTIGRPQF
jgi:hypothetical protein